MEETIRRDGRDRSQTRKPARGTSAAASINWPPICSWTNGCRRRCWQKRLRRSVLRDRARWPATKFGVSSRRACRALGLHLCLDMLDARQKLGPWRRSVVGQRRRYLKAWLAARVLGDQFCIRYDAVRGGCAGALITVVVGGELLARRRQRAQPIGVQLPPATDAPHAGWRADACRRPAAS